LARSSKLGSLRHEGIGLLRQPFPFGRASLRIGSPSGL